MAIPGTGALPPTSSSTQPALTTTAAQVALQSSLASSSSSSANQSSSIPTNPSAASKVDAPAKSALKLKKWKRIAFGGLTGTLILGGAGLIAGGTLTSNPLLVTAGIVCIAVGGIFLLIAAYAAYRNYKARANANPPIVPNPSSTTTPPSPPFVTSPPIQPSASGSEPSSAPKSSTSTSTTTVTTAATTTTTLSATSTTSTTTTASGTGVQDSSPATSAPAIPSSELTTEERLLIASKVFDDPSLILKPSVAPPGIFSNQTNLTTSICTVPVSHVTSTSSTAPVSAPRRPITTPGSMARDPSRIVYPKNYCTSSSYEYFPDPDPDSPLVGIGKGGTDFYDSTSAFGAMRSDFRNCVIPTPPRRSPILPKPTEEEEENKHNDAGDYAVNTASLSSPSSVSSSSNQATSSINSRKEAAKKFEKDAKVEADSRVALSVFEKLLDGRVWDIVECYKKLPDSQTLQLLGKELRLSSPLLYYCNRTALLNIITAYMLLKDPHFAVTKIAKVILDSRFVKVLADSGFAVATVALKYIFGIDNGVIARSEEDEKSLTAGDVAAGAFELYTGQYNKSPELMMEHFLESHSPPAVVQEGDWTVALAKAYDVQWRVDHAQVTVKSKIVNCVSQFVSKASVQPEEAQKLAGNIVNAMGVAISETLVALQAQEKQENERLTSTANMLLSFFRGDDANSHPIVKAIVDRTTEVIAYAIKTASAKVGEQYIKFNVVTKVGEKLIEWGSEECLELMKESRPELFKMLNGIVESDAIKGAIANAFNKASFIGHLWVYADHWQTVTKSLFNDQGQFSCNAIIASGPANPKLALAFSSICSIISRGESPDTFAGYLKSAMAAYECYNYVSSADPVAFGNRLKETIKADGFFDVEGQKLVESCNDEFRKFWTAAPNPLYAEFADRFNYAMSQSKGVRIIMDPNAPKSLNDALKTGVQRSLDVSGQNEAAAIAADVAMNHGPGMAAKAAQVKLDFAKADYYEAGVNVFKFLSSGFMAAGDGAVQHKLHDEARKAKNVGVGAAVDIIDFDTLLRTGVARLNTFGNAFSRGREVGNREEEHKVRVEIEEVPEIVPPAANANAIPG